MIWTILRERGIGLDFKKRSFDSYPNLDCDATGREGENRDDDLRLVDWVRRLLLSCPQVPSLWSSQSWSNNASHSEAMNIPWLPNTWTAIYIRYLQLGLFWQPSNRHKCKQQVPRRRDTKSKQVVFLTLAIHGRPLRIVLGNITFRQHFRSGMSPIMRGWRVIFGSCQRRFLWCWRKFKLQVIVQ